MGDRRNAREAALQILFQEDFKREPFSLQKELETECSGLDFNRQIVNGVLLHRVEIDQLIEKHTQHWSPERMATTDHNVLRMAIFEMLYLKETPPKVVMNEAIEIAKKYGNENSGAFVNGILDAIHHALPV